MKILFLALSLFTSGHIFGAELISFTPEGNIKDIKQVVAKFNTEMIPMGSPQVNTDIFNIDCFGKTKDNKIELQGHSFRWADNKTWIMDFDNPMESGITCEFSLKNTVVDLAKTKLTKTRKYFFSTGGPRIIAEFPYNNGRISNEQYFIVQTDGVINLKSFENLVYFEVSGINEKVKSKIISDKNRDVVIQYAIEHNSDWYQLRKTFQEVKKDQAALAKFKAENFNNFIVFAASRKFPDGANIVIHFSKGLASTTGIVSEDEKTLQYESIPPFTAEFSCPRTSVTDGCNPVQDVEVIFSNEVLASDLRNAVMSGPGGKTWKPIEFNDNAKKSLNDESGLTSIHFKAPFPEKANFKIVLPNKLKDTLGRSLTNQNKFPLSFSVTAYSPLIKFNGRFGILEFVGGANLPVSVRNIEKKILFDQSEVQGKSLNLASMDQIKKIIDLYQRVQEKEEYPSLENDQRNVPVLKKNEGKLFYIPKPLGENDYEMMGIPLVNPGFYAVEVRSPKLGATLTTTRKEMYVPTTALVTNMAVHFKKGMESSLVWVTNMQDANPVENALISVRNCNGAELASGKTGKDGTVRLKGLAFFTHGKDCGQFSSSLYVFAKKDNDFSFVSSDWAKGIESFRYSVPMKYFYEENSYEDAIFHTVLDRVLFRPGETVSMKHFFREHHEYGFQFLKKADWPLNVLVRHSATDKIFTIPLVIDSKTTSAFTTLKLPKDAPYGKYDVYISNKADKKKTNAKLVSEEGNEDEAGEPQFDYRAKMTGSFTVADYRLPVMQANVKIQGDELVKPKNINVDVSAQYLSGGPASKLNVKMRQQILSTFVTPEFIGSEEYSYYSEKIKTGIIEEFKNEEDADGKSLNIETKTLVLDKNGGEKANFNIEEVSMSPKRVSVEMEYVDPNGEIKTANTFKTIYPSKYVVGVKVDSWISNPDLTKLDGVVVDLKNNRVPNHKFKVTAFQRVYYTHRKRLVGGFYSYDSKKEIKSVGTICEGITGSDGTFACEAKNLPPGYILLEASVDDENSNPVYANTEIEVFAKGADLWWTPGDSDRIDLLPEKKMVEPNEVAKIMVKTPFKEATALVTIEREGVLDSFVTKVFRDKPVIDVPIKKNYAPNVYLSVTLIRGRIAEAKSDFLVDLNRPALKMGLIPLKVGWKSHLLNVNVETDKKKYNVREKVAVTIKLHRADGTPLPKGSFVTLIAFDESLVLLKKNDSFDILQSMMNERPLAVATSSGQNQIIGKRHFGSKAKAPGGGGGHGNDGSSRELFNPLLAFIPEIKVDDDGIAHATVTLNDAMTSFRIVAVATSGADLFGYGKTNIVSSKDLILYSGSAPLVRNNDEINNKYTVRNTSEKEMKVNFKFSVNEFKENEKSNFAQSFTLAPSEAKVLSIPLSIPKNINQLTYKVSAIDENSKATDSVLSKIAVDKDLKDSVLMATLFQLENNNSISVKEPENAITGSGGVNISMTKSLVSGLTGVKSYMEEYPYSCLEQQVSKAIVANDKKEISRIVKGLMTYQDEDGLLRFFSNNYSCGSSMLSVYILSIFRENKIEIPLDVKNKVLEGLRHSLDGNLKCHVWWESYLKHDFYDQEKIKILSALSYEPNFRDELLQSIKIVPNEWTTEAVLYFKQILKNVPSFKDHDALLSQVNNILKSRANFQGTIMNLQSTLNDFGRYALFSSADQEANLYLLDAIKDPNYKDDIGRLARGVVARLNRGTWDSTTSNAWGVTALNNFSNKFEKTPITGSTEVSLADKNKVLEWNKNNSPLKTLLPWPSDSKMIAKGHPVNFKMNGTGKPWVTLQTKSAIPLDKPLELGFSITKKILPIEVKKEGQYSVGDVLNIELVIKAKTDQPWVAVMDPIVAGATHLGTGLEGSSEMLDRSLKTTADGSISFPEDYTEKKFANFISYAGYLPAGVYKVTYRIRLNSSGKFKLPNTRVEAMYSPEVFGEIKNNDMEVVE